MPTPIVHLAATVTCTHAGPATPTTPEPRVLVSGQPVVAVGSPYAVAGCGLTGSSTPPCVSAQWVAGAARVLVGGRPVAVQGGSSVATPTGQPLLPLAVQPRVVAT